MESALRRRCEGVRAVAGRAIKRILGLALIGPQRTGNIHRGIPLAQTKPVYFVVGVPGYDKREREGMSMRMVAT